MRDELTARAQSGLEALAETRPGVWTWRLLGRSPDGRAILEYRCGDERLVGKLMGPARRSRDEAAFLAELARATTTVLRVPVPVLWLPAARVLVTTVAEGEPCTDLDVDRRPTAFVRIGQALRELHALASRAPRPVAVDEPVGDLMRPQPAALARAFPARRALIGRALARLHADAAGWGVVSTVRIHRDFQLRNLFDDGRRITVIDWDDAAWGDPAFDVGYFATYLKTHRSDGPARTAIAAFRAGYGDEAPWERVPTWERFNLLRRACRRHRLRDVGWEEELGRMFEALELSLD